MVTSLAFSQNSQNFDTPEAVMRYFVDNVKNGNFDNVFLTSPYSNDSLIRRINPREVINYVGVNIFNLENMPVQYHSIMKYNLLGRYSTIVKRFVFILLLSENYPEFVNMKPMNINDTVLDNYFSSLNIQNLRTLEFVRMDVYKPDIQFSERGRDNAKRQYVNTYGCDEKIEYTVLLRHNRKYYVCGAVIVRYGSNWYIDTLAGTYANIGQGNLIQVSGIGEYLKNFEIE
jgi:hypothetical protein